MKTNRATDVYKRTDLLSLCRFLLVFSSCCHPGCSEYYESVQWTPQNPMFRFSNESIHHRLSVLPNNKLIFICPNPSTYLNDIQKPITINQMYENLWYVDEQSFQTCTVGRRKEKGINSLLLECKNPKSLNYHELVFQPFSAVTPLSFQPGSEHYFIATSNGSKSSLNSTSGGHCKDIANGISMKMIIYICNSDADPKCKPVTTPPPVTSVTINNGTTEKPEIATNAARTSSSHNLWHLLAIIFAVALACSLVLHSICLFLVCRRNTAKKSGDEKLKVHQPLKENGLENVDVRIDTL